MNEHTYKPEIKVLIIDDEPGMARNLMDAFRRFDPKEIRSRFSEHKRQIAPGVERLLSQNCKFLPHCIESVERIGSGLLGLLHEWDVFVIDRNFGGNYRDLFMLESLRDLGTSAVRIVWTAFGDKPAAHDAVTPNIIQCMRLGAWDYIDKRESRFGNTMTDVVISAVEGLARREQEDRRALINVKASQCLAQDEKLRQQYAGQFVAFIEETPGSWRALVSSPSLYGLYGANEVRERDRSDLFITMFQAGLAKPQQTGSRV